MMPQDWTTFLSVSLIAASIVIYVMAALRDIAIRIVPDWYSLAIGAAGVILRLIDGNLLLALALAILALVIGAIFLRIGQMGGADVKLITAAALVVPPPLLVSFLMAMSIAGAILTLPYLAGRLLDRPAPHGRPRRIVARWWRIERRRLRRGEVPYACAITAGILFTLL